MMFPIEFWNISLLFALISIVLLITSELLSSRYSNITIFLDRKKMKYTAFTTSIIFLATVVIRLGSIIIS